MNSRIIFLGIMIVCAVPGQLFSAQNDDNRPRARRAAPSLVTKHIASHENLYPNSHNLISVLGVIMGYYGAKLYYQGCEKISCSLELNDKVDKTAASGSQLQSDGLKLFAVGLLLIVHKDILDYIQDLLKK